MKLERIEFANIGSYGNKKHVIEYNNEGKLILLSGKSGAGKSTLLNLPSILFYGKVEKMSKTGIVNRINKNGYIKGWIKSRNEEFIIERKFSPNSILVFKDGIDINTIGVKDAQQFIDSNIIKIPYQIFNNIICLSMNKFKSFLNMSPNDRRDIIDRVFNLESVNNIANFIKKDLKDLGLSVNSENTKVFTLRNTITKAEKELMKLSQKKDNGNSQKIKDNNKIVDTETGNINNLNVKANKLSAAYKKIYGRYSADNNNLQNLRISLKNISDKIDLFKQDKCPTCGTDFKSNIFNDVKQKLEGEKVKINSDITKVTANASKLYTFLTKLNAVNKTIEKNMKVSQNNINIAQAENSVIQKNMKNSEEYNSINNIINDNTQQLKKSVQSLNDLKSKIDDLNVLSVLYSVDGVKKQVIKNYLPQLNNEIKKSLLILDFPYQLTFSENFDSQLSYLGNIIGSDTLSEGEHKRVDLAVLCSIFKLLKRKYPSINIFTLDEVLSSLDTITASAMLRFIKNFCMEMKLNTFVVTHVEMETDLFDEQIKVTKDMGFSDFEIV